MVLSFLVDKQIITRVDKEKVVRDSMNYLYANFEFSPDWTGQKTAVFKSKSGAFNVLLDDDGKCLVPWEVLQDEVIEISVFCGALITANVVKIITLASGYTIGEEGREPTPDVYTQIMEKLSEIEAEVDPEAIQALIDAYLADKDYVTEADVETIVAAYVEDHKSEWQGSEVEVTPTLSSGTKIAEISVDGTTTNLYAPNGGGGATALDDLTDVDLTTPQSGDVLVYDGQKWGNGKDNPYSGKNVVHMGDSIVHLYNVAELSAEKAGYNVTNCGFQATAITDLSNVITNSKYFSLIRLAKAIRDNDWTEQDTYYDSSKWGTQLSTLKNVDWSTVDVLVLSYGTNDWGIQSKLGDSYARDDYSICGALKTAIGIFNNINPDMEIIVTTPIYRYFRDNEAQLTQVQWGNVTFIEYRNMIALAASACGVKLIDLWALSGVNEYNHSLTLISDGLHPTPKGQEMWANAFVGALESGYCGVASLEPNTRTTIPNASINLVQDSEIFLNHLKFNATYCMGSFKFLCTAKSAADSECVFATILYNSLPSGTKIHIDGYCGSTTAQEHSIGFRLFDPITNTDVLNKSATVVQSLGQRGVEFTTTEAYTNKILVFYLKNATAFSESVALARNVTCTVTLPS